MASLVGVPRWALNAPFKGSAIEPRRLAAGQIWPTALFATKRRLTNLLGFCRQKLTNSLPGEASQGPAKKTARIFTKQRIPTRCADVLVGKSVLSCGKSCLIIGRTRHQRNNRQRHAQVRRVHAQTTTQSSRQSTRKIIDPLDRPNKNREG